MGGRGREAIYVKQFDAWHQDQQNGLLFTSLNEGFERSQPPPLSPSPKSRFGFASLWIGADLSKPDLLARILEAVATKEQLTLHLQEAVP